MKKNWREFIQIEMWAVMGEGRVLTVVNILEYILLQYFFFPHQMSEIKLKSSWVLL